jgi:tetratricopeptide (TPR) repeat protein
VTLVGEAGVGKSRLAAELRARLAGRALAVEGRCPPYGEGVTYWPLAEILRTLAGLRPDDRADAARARLAGLLPDEDWSGLAAERLAAAVGAGEGQQARSDEIAWAFRRVLEAVATEQPLLVVLDDVHWAEPTLLDLVDYLAGWSRSAPILVLCLTRGDLLERRPGWGSGEGWATVVLGPLPRADIVRLVELLGGGERADEIADVAAGNALFATELVRMLLDERRRPSTRRTTYAGRVPATIQAVLSARLDLLADDERAVLQRAAVVGEVFWWGAVSALAPPELAPRTGSLLAALVRSDLVRPDPAALAGEDGLRFGHVLVREAAYSSIPKRGRADLHERLAVWLEERQGGAPGEQDALAGHHLEQAARYWRELGDAAQAAALAGRASERLVAAGRRAFRLGDMPAALDRLARAAALRPDGDPERARLLVDAAIAAKNAGDFATSTALLDGVVATATDAAVQYAARIERAHCRLMTGEGGPEELLAAAEGAVAASGETGDQAGLAHGWNYVGFELFVRGRFGAMVEMLERGCAHARRVGDTREEQRSLTGIATGLLLGPAPVREAAARCRRIADRSRAIAPWGAAVPAAALAGLEAMRGRVERGWASYEEARNALADTGPPLQSANLPLAAAPLLAHDPERFERELHEAYDLLERLGERGALSTVAAYLAGAVLSQGRGVEAESLTRVSERAAAPEDVLSQIVWRTVRARALSRRGEPDLARELASAGVELARRTDSPLLVAGALLALAEAERELGAADAGAGHAGEALELALRKGDEVTAAHARELLPLDPRVETR